MSRLIRTLPMVIALAVAFAMTPGTPAQADGAKETAAVKALNAKWDAAFNNGDLATVASLYAEDARVVTADGNVIEGRQAIQNLFQSFVDGGFHAHKIELIDVRVNGNVAYETAKWTGVGGDKKTYSGHLVNVFERDADGNWKNRLHIWN